MWKQCSSDVRQWKAQVDFFVVSFHWGISKGGTHTGALHQKVIGRHAVNAGADLVPGHHSHALQAVEIYWNKPICYGLGNFGFALEEGFPRETMLFQCTFSRHKLHDVKFLPATSQGRDDRRSFLLNRARDWKSFRS